jgi:hypothetical protein
MSWQRQDRPVAYSPWRVTWGLRVRGDRGQKVTSAMKHHAGGGVNMGEGKKNS